MLYSHIVFNLYGLIIHASWIVYRVAVECYLYPTTHKFSY